MPRYPTRRATSCGGVVCDDRPDGRRWVLLIARRNAAGKPQWTLPKGGIEDGETDEQAALREVREETGYGALIEELLGTIEYWFVWRPDQVRYHKFVHYYFMWWDGQPPGPRDDGRSRTPAAPHHPQPTGSGGRRRCNAALSWCVP